MAVADGEAETGAVAAPDNEGAGVADAVVTGALGVGDGEPVLGDDAVGLALSEVVGEVLDVGLELHPVTSRATATSIAAAPEAATRRTGALPTATTVRPMRAACGR